MKETRTLSVAEVTDIVRDESSEKVKMNALAGATIKIIGTEFVVEFLKKANGGYTLILAPKKPDEAEKHSLTDMINAVKGFFGEGADVDTSELESLVNEGGGSNFDNVFISLAMAFLYINKENGESDEKEVEYAFQIKAENLGNLIPEGVRKFVDVGDAQLAIWNTTRQKVIDAMGLVKPEDLLKEL